MRGIILVVKRLPENPQGAFLYAISPDLWKVFEGRYSPANAYEKRTPKNVYAKTREECEEKLAELITQMNAEIAAEKERLKSGQSA